MADSTCSSSTDSERTTSTPNSSNIANLEWDLTCLQLHSEQAVCDPEKLRVKRFFTRLFGFATFTATL